MKTFDLVIKNARVVRPNDTGVGCLDIGIANGKVTRLAAEIRAEDAGEVFDAKSFWLSPAASMPTCMSASIGRWPRTR
jgi:allantoinase